MAEEGAMGSEFPVFKSEGGAFDRAKFDGSIQNIENSNISREEIDAIKAADSASEAAKIFYNQSFDKNVRNIDPALDSKSIYYKEADSNEQLDKNDIQNRIDKGEEIDGKEIFEMSKNSAMNKVENAKILKNGKAIEIIENIGPKDIKNLSTFDTIKNEFDGKTSDDKLKFEPLLDSFFQLLDTISDKANRNTEADSLLYTEENSAIVSALSKILESEGFTNESIVLMSKRYEENINKLIEKYNDKKVEPVGINPEGEKGIEIKATQPEGKIESVGLEERKEEPKKESIISEIPENKNTETVASVSPIEATQQKTIEIKLEEKSEPSAPKSNLNTGTEKLEEKSTQPLNKSELDMNSVERAQEEILSLLGIKKSSESTSINPPEIPSAVEGGRSEVSSAQDAILQSLGISKMTASPISNTIESTLSPVREVTETAVAEKKSEIIGKIAETSSGISPIKETTYFLSY